MKVKKRQPRALLVDGNWYLHRAYHSVKLLTNKDGFPTNAVRGFFAMLTADMKMLRPDYLVVFFDAAYGTKWRKDLLPQYKGNRKKNRDPDEMERIMCQLTPIRRILKALGVRVVAKKDCEADDAMATMALDYKHQGILAMMSTKDKDLCQTIGGLVVRVEPKTRLLEGAKEIQLRFGVKPHQIIELLMLMGDTSDNVPGVYKCGEKTAAKWLNEYGSIKNLLKNVENLTPAASKNLTEAKKYFKVTRQVLTIDTSIPLTTTVAQTHVDRWKANVELFEALCTELDLKTTKSQIEKVFLL